MNNDKPLPPVKPEKLKSTFHVTIVPAPEVSEAARAVVLTEMKGSEVIRRKVVDTVPDVQLAMDEYNRLGTRIFFFGNPGAQEFE